MKRLAAALACWAAAGAITAVAAVEADHYAFELRPEVAARALFGHARITLRATVGATAIELPAPSLQILAARLDGRPVLAERTAAGWRIGIAGAEARELELDWRAGPGAGLVFGEGFVHTAFQACQWMPCVGTSDLARAAVSIRLELPDGWRAVASEQPAGRPYPLYTLGFAAGRFIEGGDAKDPRLRWLAIDDGRGAAALQRELQDSARMLAFFEDRAGLPLPQPAYTQMVLPGGAAQEASAFSFIGREMLAPLQDDPQEDWVIAHEMAHQWWGNLVGCASWHELWLNEGLVVFMTAAWKQQRWGEAAYAREMQLARQRWQRARDAGWERPLSWRGEYPGLSMKRAIQYSKGALFFDALRNELGEAVFSAGLRRYTRTHAGRAVGAAELQQAFEAAAGRPLQALFEAWVY